MIKENYNIIKVEVNAGFSYGSSSSHELIVWFEGMDVNKRGYTENVLTYHLKQLGITKSGYSFKKSKEFYDSNEGKKWLGNF